MIPARPVCFQSRLGHVLHGILHEPDDSVARGVCVLLLSPGVKGRVGPHRLYLKVAARLVPLGFHVLRFDFHGLGDSEGELPERALADVYNMVHEGRYAADTIDAMDWMEHSVGIRRFVGSGLCGGSISALVTAEADRRIECLLGLGLPTVLEGGPENWARLLTQQQAAALSGSYFGKVTDPKSLWRFLSGKSSYRAVWRVIRQWLAARGRSVDAEIKPRAAEIDRTNPRFASAFMAMLQSSRPMLLIFAGADRLRSQFAEHFESHNEARLRDLRHVYEVHVIPEANHVFAEAASVSELLDVSERWLVARYASH
jgi:uncharacterized protein